MVKCHAFDVSAFEYLCDNKWLLHLCHADLRDAIQMLLPILHAHSCVLRRCENATNDGWQRESIIQRQSVKSSHAKLSSADRAEACNVQWKGLQIRILCINSKCAGKNIKWTLNDSQIVMIIHWMVKNIHSQDRIEYTFICLLAADRRTKRKWNLLKFFCFLRTKARLNWILLVYFQFKGNGVKTAQNNGENGNEWPSDIIHCWCSCHAHSLMS